MIDEEATFKKFGYYSFNLLPCSHRLLIAVCELCGKVREIPKDGYRTLCLSCGHQEKNSPNRKGKTKCICLQCGKEFKLFPSVIKAGRGNFCSLGCKNKAQKKQVKCICLQCCKTFEVSLSKTENDSGKYCSIKCKNKAREIKRIECICQWCGNKIHILPNDKKYNRGRYCSKKCAGNAHSKGGKKVAQARSAAKRKQLLSYTLLLPLREGEVGHHVTNEYVIGIPKDVHEKRCGGGREKHRTKVLLWLKDNDIKKYKSVLCVLAKEP